MATGPVPEDFPRQCARGAVPGAQPKLLARGEAGRFVSDDATEAEVWDRYELCEDLVQQLVRYSARKQAERPEWTAEQVREKVAASVRQRGFGWGLSPSETEWVVGRLAAHGGGQDPGKPTS
jgi:hypothetical protein